MLSRSWLRGDCQARSKQGEVQPRWPEIISHHSSSILSWLWIRAPWGLIINFPQSFNPFPRLFLQMVNNLPSVPIIINHPENCFFVCDCNSTHILIMNYLWHISSWNWVVLGILMCCAMNSDQKSVPGKDWGKQGVREGRGWSPATQDGKKGNKQVNWRRGLGIIRSAK